MSKPWWHTWFDGEIFGGMQLSDTRPVWHDIQPLTTEQADMLGEMIAEQLETRFGISRADQDARRAALPPIVVPHDPNAALPPWYDDNVLGDGGE